MRPKFFQSTGFAPADTLKNSPQGILITLVTSSAKSSKKDTTIEFKSHSTESSNRTIQDWCDSKKRYYDTVTGNYVYFDEKPEPAPKTIWQKIKDIFSKDTNKAEENTDRYIYSPMGE